MEVEASDEGIPDHGFDIQLTGLWRDAHNFLGRILGQQQDSDWLEQPCIPTLLHQIQCQDRVILIASWTGKMTLPKVQALAENPMLTVDSLTSGFELHCVWLVHQSHGSRMRQHKNRTPNIRKADS